MKHVFLRVLLPGLALLLGLLAGQPAQAQVQQGPWTPLNITNQASYQPGYEVTQVSTVLANVS